MSPLRTDALWLCVLGVVVIAASAVITEGLDIQLHFDEAQYWEWSQRLDWSYYSKGPLVAWLMAASQGLFGQGEWQVRAPAWLAHALWLGAVYGFARTVWGGRAEAWWAVVLVLASPMYFTLGLVMTTDIWLFLFWTLGLWAVYRALVQEQPRAWYVAGAAVGIGAMAKLSIGLLPAAVGIAVLVTPGLRHHLRRPPLWGGLALMAAIMSPMVLWNTSHDWVMLRHEMGHISGGSGWSISRAGIFLAGQWLLALTPVVGTLMILALWQPPWTFGQRLLWALSLGWLAFFLFKSLEGKVQLNWPAPIYIALWVLFAGAVARFSYRRRHVLYGGLGLAVVMMAISYNPYAFGLSAKQDPFQELRSWRQPVTTLAQQVEGIDFILVPRYHLAGEFAFYWPDTPRVYVAGSRGRRFNQHDLWPSIDREAGRTGLWVSTKAEVPAELSRAFAHCQELAPITARASDGSPLRTFYPQRCQDYQAIDWPQPQRY